jgi:hypothetical protein
MTKLTRRDFIKLSAGLATTAAALAACKPLGAPTEIPISTATPPTASPTVVLAPTAAPISEQTIARALRRLMFAPKPEDYARAKQIGLEKFVDEMLQQPSGDDPNVAAKIKGFTTLTMSPTELVEYDVNNKRGTPGQELIKATTLRAVYSQHQLYELMTDFWTNHFNIYIRKNLTAVLKTADDREVVRKYALGKFYDMLTASAHSPAMMIYLDNFESTKNKPNENYARELLELHTLGVDGGYTQQDVQELARVLTGWSVAGKRSAKPGDFEYRQNIHDTGTKSILGKKYENNGQQEGELVLQALAKHRSTANYVAKKLVRRFVADDPPQALTAKAAKTYTDSDGDIPKVMKTIIMSDEFRASLGQKFKRPFEFIVSALRVTNAQVDPGNALNLYLNQMGQPLFQWSTPDGYPDEAGAWATTNGMLTRWNFAIALCSNTIREAKVDLAALTKDAATIDAAIDSLSMAFLGEKLPNEGKQILTKFGGSSNVKTATPMLAALILGSPYFQYR